MKFQVLWDSDSETVLVHKLDEGNFRFIVVLDMHDATGEETGDHYNVTLQDVDLASCGQRQIEAARECCDVPEDADDLTLADAVRSYGAAMPLGQWNGNNKAVLLREARAEARNLLDPDALETAMDRPVNAIGSTAREFARGDIYSAMERGCRAGDRGAQIMAKMYGASSEAIEAIQGTPEPKGVAASIALPQVPSDDPLAYTMGFMHAMAGGDLEGPRNELAPAYIEGFQVGVDVKAGRTPQPAWVK